MKLRIREVQINNVFWEKMMVQILVFVFGSWEVEFIAWSLK